MTHRRVTEVVYVASNEAFAPPLWMELAYFALTFYGVMSVAWGISVRMVAAGGLAFLAAVCLVLEWNASAFHRALIAPILCAVTFVVIQIVVHGEALGGGFSVTFVTWVLSVIIMQALMLRRGFFHRFVPVCLAISFLVLPFLNLKAGGTGIVRAGLDKSVAIGNPNDFGAWVGFCCAYFVILGIETRRVQLRVIAWIIAAACLLIVGLTVSRGPLLSVAVVTVVAFRRFLKQGFVPALVFFAGLWMLYGVGVFDQMLGSYAARGAEESGRLVTWPLIVERISQSPIFGVGASNIGTFVEKQGQAITPHNSYLFFPLASGILPTGFFLTYLVQAARRSLVKQDHAELLPDQAFRFPLLLYLMLSCVSLDFPFIAQWGVATVCLAMSVMISRPRLRVGYPASDKTRRARRTDVFAADAR
jgi:hypothetical protein